MNKLEFTTPRSLIHLFDNISLEDYYWYLYETEIVVDDKDWRHDGKIDPSELYDLLSNPQTLIIFLNLQAFEKHSPETRVYNRKEFISAQCVMTLLISDAYFTEVYVGPDTLFQTLLENAQKCVRGSVNVVAENDDGRTRFCLWNA